MAKKKRNKQGKEKAARANKGKSRQFLLVSAMVITVSVAAGFLLAGDGPDKGPKATGGEGRPTLSPRYFLGKTARAYQAAREIPQVLDRIYCYCRCQENFGHKSLLTCFTDKHGSQCGICMDEVLMARDLHKKGYKTKEIVKKVDGYFSRRKI